MAKKVAGELKLQIPAGKANPSPPVGPALGQRGLNIMEFCKAFNAKTQEMEAGAPCPTIITYYVDKSFSMEIKTPPASFFLKKAVNIKSGSQTAGKETIAQISSIKIQNHQPQQIFVAIFSNFEIHDQMLESILHVLQ